MITSGPLRVDPEGRFFRDGKGRPFFWQGDTAWPLLTAYSKKDAEYFLKLRAGQGFNVIQTVAAWEHGGSHSGTMFSGPVPGRNPEGQSAWQEDPSRPNPRFFAYAERVMKMAEKLGIYIAMVPVWGYYVNDNPVLTAPKALAYGKWLGKRFRNQKNLIWMNGGDRIPTHFEAVYQALAAGLRQGGTRQLMTYHPCGWRSSSQFWHKEKWLDFNMIETWTEWTKIHQAVTSDLTLSPAKPVVLGEGAYEDGPEYPQGPITPLVVRKQAWWAYLAGGCFTYGQNDQWRMGPGWRKNVNAPASNQIKVIRQVLEAGPWWTLVQDQGIFVNGPGSGPSLNAAARSQDGSWIVIYLSGKGTIQLHLDHLTAADRCKATWVNPMTGEAQEAGAFETGNLIPGRGFPEARTAVFSPPSTSEDFVLVLKST